MGRDCDWGLGDTSRPLRLDADISWAKGRAEIEVSEYRECEDVWDSRNGLRGVCVWIAEVEMLYEERLSEGLDVEVGEWGFGEPKLGEDMLCL